MEANSIVSRILLRANEVAEVLGISRARAYELMAAEIVPTVRIGRSVRVPREALVEWVAAQTRTAEGACI